MAKYLVLGTVISHPSDKHFYAGEIVETFPKDVVKEFLENNQIELVDSKTSTKNVVEAVDPEITSETVSEPVVTEEVVD